jgi:UDP-N-acetylglucosamine--N-acetylmuramyl-(pentapeptide) pyrophosphoryl-undecaprenol N-acetylglucosamine transferase
MKDLIFFSSPIGLGHVTRDVAIVNNLESVSAKFITGSNAAKFLSNNGFKVENCYRPPQFEIKDGFLSNSLSWLWKYYKYYKNCKVISSDIIKKENPAVVISDEDFASLSVAQESSIPTILITDILETRFTKGIGSLIEKKMNRSMKDIMKKCDVVILPEEGKDHENIKCVGPIVRTTKFTREELRKRLSFDKKTIIVSVGGTAAGNFLIKKVIECFSKLKEDVDLVIVSGSAIEQNYEKNIRNLGFVNNLHEVIFASDLIISLAGKSTIDEAKAYGTPGIFIPIKGHFEQEDNAKEEGYSFDDINRLELLIPQRLAQRRPPTKFDGSIKAAKIIQSYLKKDNCSPPV